MNKTILCFLTTTLAGLSTTLGIIPCFFKTKNQNSMITNSFSFASGVMITITIISLIPEAISNLNNTFKKFPALLICSIFIVLGIIISATIEENENKKKNNNQLYTIGIITTLAMIIHNIPEGITTFIFSNINQKLGIKLAISIAMHNIPEGISIAIPIYYATNNRKKAFINTFIAGFSELFGAIIAFLFFKKISTLMLSIILSITAGIMLNISISELLPTVYKNEKSKTIIYYFALGIIFMFITEIII